MGWVLIIVGLILVGIVIYTLMYPGIKQKHDATNQVLDVHEKYSAQQTRFEARRETKAATARKELAQELGNEATAVIGMVTQDKRLLEEQHHLKEAPRRLQREEELEEEAHQRQIAAEKLEQKLIGLASAREMDLMTYAELTRKFEMDKLELEKQWQEAEQKLKAGFIYQLQAHQHLALMTEYIGKLYDRAKQLEKEGKDRELKLIEEHISFMESDFRERQRLLQAADRQDVQSSNQSPQLGGDNQPPVETDTSLR